MTYSAPAKLSNDMSKSLGTVLAIGMDGRMVPWDVMLGFFSFVAAMPPKDLQF